MPAVLSRRWLILLAVMLAFTPVVIDMTILHIAVPSLTLALNASANEVLWIIDIYPLLMAGLLVPMGTLADRIGHRRLLLTGLGIFGTASLLAAFAPTPAMLIGTRALLALGGSMILPCVLGIIRRTFDDEKERAMALGLWGTVGAAGAALGPLIGGGLLLVFVRLQLRASQPLLDLSLFSRPAILAGIIMAVMASGALAGVELTLAQELQYVMDKTPLQAGIFMIPIMAAAALGGPVAGHLSNLCGLRAIASLSLVVAAVALAGLALSDFNHPGLTVPLLLALLGLSLSIGLTASSIAIMSSVDASQGGAAGSMEATAYELGSGLGITLFGVFLSGVYSHTIVLALDITSSQARHAARSIGDTHVVARDLAEPQAKVLIEAGKAAFSSSHSILLMTAAALLAVLSIVVIYLLRERPAPQKDKPA